MLGLIRFITGTFLSITYLRVTPIIPDSTDKNMVMAMVIPVFAPSDTLNTEAIKTPIEMPAKSPTAESRITRGVLSPKSTFRTNLKNSIKIAIPTMLTRYEPIAELKTIMLFLLGETEILFPLLLIFARQLLIAVSPNIPQYIHVIAIRV